MANADDNRPEIDPEHLGTHYVDSGFLADGTFDVFSAFDREQQHEVAMKRLPKSNDLHTKRTYREIYLLKQLWHPNIVELCDVFCVPPTRNWNCLYLVMPLMPVSLKGIIEDEKDQLTTDVVRWLTVQLICGVQYIHSANVIHRDIKPANILVDSHCHLRICDFGLARVANAAHIESGQLTRCVQTQWWRAPEVELNPRRYTNSVDMWSVGCVLGEMLIGGPLFPGENSEQQIDLIIRVIGTPTDEELVLVGEAAVKHVKQLPNLQKKQQWSSLVPNREANVYELLDALLVFVPDRRITAAEALKYAFLAQYRPMADESVSNAPLTVDIEPQVSMEDLEDMIEEEIQVFQQPQDV